jgi:hypothetical protein
MKIDHVSVAGRELESLEQSFSRSGMKTDYGGPHSNGVTEMSLLGFPDGSYIELISTIEPRTPSPIWNAHISGNGGPCAWAIEAEDIAVEASRAARLGLPVNGPSDYSRKRPDRVLVEWKLAFIGDQEAGATLPFLIKDTTPRDYRVKPSQSVADGLLSGIGTVVLGVDDIGDPAREFGKLYEWPWPESRRDLWGGVELASFPETPVVLAAPTKDGWLKRRLERYGPSPCAFLIETTDMEKASKRFPLEKREEWFGGKELRWVHPLKEEGLMIGLVDGSHAK